MMGLTHRAMEALSRHNRLWSLRCRQWYLHNGVEWTPGVIADNALRGRVSTYLPWEELSASFRNIGRAFLPDPSWIPSLLLPGHLDSIIDFWHEAPVMSGRVTLSSNELLSFFCLLADPPRFGTAVGRYPGQLSGIRERIDILHPAILDIGCGIGLGTLEIANALQASSATGITSEPLEVWMAMHRWLPHDRRRSSCFAEFDSVPAKFILGNATDFSIENKVEIIICNGLAGGRFLHHPKDISAFLDRCEHCLHPRGLLALANAFHEGHRANVEEMLKTAVRRGWTVEGTWQMAYLRHS